MAHPYDVLKDKAELVIASPKGGAAPLDPGSVEAFANDPVASAFVKEKEPLWSNTVKLSDVKASDFDAIFYVGGHGRKSSTLPVRFFFPNGFIRELLS